MAENPSYGTYETINAISFLKVGGLQVSDGTSAAPSLTFVNDTGLGIWRSGTSELSLTDGATKYTFDLANNSLRMNTSQIIGWGSGDPSVTANDTILLRDAANTLALRNGNADQAFLVGGANGVATGYKTLSELTTIAAAATTDTAIQLPANAIVLAVSVRVTTAIPTAATFTVIGTTTSTAFQTGASVSTTANTTDVGTKSCPYLNTSAQTIRFTPNLTPADTTGRVRVTIHYIQITPPTS